MQSLKLFKDMLTEPNNETYSCSQVLGFAGYIIACILTIITSILNQQFDIKTFLEASAIYLTAIGGIYGVHKGIDVYSKKS